MMPVMMMAADMLARLLPLRARRIAPCLLPRRLTIGEELGESRLCGARIATPDGVEQCLKIRTDGRRRRRCALSRRCAGRWISRRRVGRRRINRLSGGDRRDRGRAIRRVRRSDVALDRRELRLRARHVARLNRFQETPKVAAKRVLAAANAATVVVIGVAVVLTKRARYHTHVDVRGARTDAADAHVYPSKKSVERNAL